MNATVNVDRLEIAQTKDAVRSEDRIGIYIVVLFALAMLWLGHSLGVWTDELYTLHSTANGPAHAFEYALHFEQQPPFYFILLAWIRTYASSDFVARCFSIGCATFALSVLYVFAKRHVRSVSPIIVVACVAINPFFIWTAVEIRTYALILAESAVIIASFYDAFLGDRLNRSAAYVFVIASSIGIYTQYYVGSLVLGCAMVMLILKRDLIVPFALAILPFIILCVPAAKIALWQASQDDHTAVLTITNLQGLAATIETFLLPRDWAAREFNIGVVLKVGYAVFFAFCLWPIAASIALRKPLPFEARAFSVITITIIAFFLVIIFGHLEIYFPRHLTVLFIPLLLAAFSIAAPVAASDRQFGANAIAGYAMLAIASIVFVYRPLAKDGDWPRVGRFLDANAREHDVIDIVDPEIELGVGHYYHGVAKLEPLPVQPILDHWDLGPYNLRSTKAVAIAMDRVAPKLPGRRWLVISPYPCPSQPAVEGCSDVMRYVRQAYDVELERRFFRSDVLLLHERQLHKPPTT